MSYNVEIKSVKKDNFEIEYAVFGSGKKPFVIIPGLSVKSVLLSVSSVASAYSQFTDDYTVYIFDRPKNVKIGLTIYDMAEQTSEAMQLLNISSACVFGASQGGMIAQLIAVNHPDLIKKLVLGSTLSKINPTANAVINSWIDFAKKGDAYGLYNSFCENLYSEEFNRKYKAMFLMSASGVTEEELERFVVIASACDAFNAYDSLDKICCDVLVVGAEGDRVVTGKASKEIAEKLNCELFMYDKSNAHAVFDEAPDYKNRIAEFFSK